MKKGLYLVSMLILFVFLLGMGGPGGEPANKTPTPEEDFSATFIDNQDVVSETTQVSRDGKVFLLGKKGMGTVTVPFRKIKVAKFKTEKGTVIAVIELTNGKTVEIEMDKSQKFYGNVEFGTFQIEVANLKKVIFNP